MATEKQALKALEHFGNKLSKLRNVVGVGIVMATEDMESSDDEMVIAVYVEKKLPEDSIEKDQIVPKTLKLKLKGKSIKVQTRVIEQGKVTLENAPSLDRL